jgi:glycosidase
LRRGDRKNLLADKDVFVYGRTAGDDTVTVALNFSEQPQRRDVAGQTIELEPLGSVVIREPSTIST